MATLSNGDTNEKNGYSVVLLGGKISNNQGMHCMIFINLFYI
jgi:hypothetical protein